MDAGGNPGIRLHGLTAGHPEAAGQSHGIMGFSGRNRLFFINTGEGKIIFLKNCITIKKIQGNCGEMVSRFHRESMSSCRSSPKDIYPATCFAWNLGRTFSEKYFPVSLECMRSAKTFGGTPR